MSNDLAQLDAEYEALDVELPKKEGAWQPAFTLGKHEANVLAARIQNPPWPNDTALYLYVQLENPNNEWTQDVWVRLSEHTGGGLSFTKKQLIGLGYTGKLSGIADATAEMIGRKVAINVVQNKQNTERQDIYINKVVSEGPTSANDTATAEEIFG